MSINQISNYFRNGNMSDLLYIANEEPMTKKEIMSKNTKQLLTKGPAEQKLHFFNISNHEGYRGVTQG